MTPTEQKAFDQMRSALKSVNAAIYVDDAGQLRLTKSFDDGVIDAALTAAKEVQAQVKRDWMYIPRECNVQCVAWRVSFNDGKDWTLWETDPQITDKAVMVQPLYTHSTCVSPQAQRLSDAEIDAEWAEHDKAYAFVSSKWSFEAGVKFAETAFCSKNGIHLGD